MAVYAANRPGDGIRYRPRHFGNILRNAAKNFAVEVFDDFGTALIPPHVRRGDFLSVLQSENFREIRDRDSPLLHRSWHDSEPSRFRSGPAEAP